MTNKTEFQFKKNIDIKAFTVPPATPITKPDVLIRNRHVSAYLTGAEYSRFLRKLDGRSASGVMRHLILTHLADEDERT